MTLEYEKLLLLKSPQNKVASPEYCDHRKKEKEVRHIIYARGILLLILQMTQ